MNESLPDSRSPLLSCGNLTRDSGFILPVKMYIDLWEGNNDAGLFKGIIDIQVQITESESALRHIGEEVASGQLQGAIIKLVENHIGLRVFGD